MADRGQPGNLLFADGLGTQFLQKTGVDFRRFEVQRLELAGGRIAGRGVQLCDPVQDPADPLRLLIEPGDMEAAPGGLCRRGEGNGLALVRAAQGESIATIEE